MILEEIQILVDLVFHGITNILVLRMVSKLLNSYLLLILHSLIGHFETLLELLMYQLTGTQSYHDTFAGEKFSKFLKFLKFSILWKTDQSYFSKYGEYSKQRHHDTSRLPMV